MRRSFSIHIFNPETDYALACGENDYYPPAKILRMRREMALFPATYAEPADWIATLDVPPSPSGDAATHMEIARSKGLRILRIEELPRLMSGFGYDDCRIKPWGWNKTLLHLLRRTGIDGGFLKTDREIDIIRDLSHRRTARKIQDFLQHRLPGTEIPKADEIFSVDEAFEYLRHTGDAYFKMPWSSSGRGVVFAPSMQADRLSQWLGGAIRRQGSVMAEPAFSRSVDFATEWECVGGEARFLGLSVFRTSAEGRYLGNIIAPQSRLHEIIMSFTSCWGEEVAAAQKEALDSLVAPFYSGPAGIDMLASTEGRLHPCVEINLRQTMGMAALSTYGNQRPGRETENQTYE